MSSTAAVLKKLLHSHKSKTVWDYSDKVDFEHLWEALSPQRDGVEETLGDDVFVCWTSTASDLTVWPVATNRFLTPLEWAACAAARCEHIRVTVIDLDPASH